MCTLELPLPTTYVTEIRETYSEIYTKQVSCPFKHLKLPISIKIPVTTWKIVYIYLRAILFFFISLTMLLLMCQLHGSNICGVSRPKLPWL